MSLSRPPEEQPSVKTFDPLVLDRTVIAIPLLKEMEEDLARVTFVEARYPNAALKYNAAIEYNPEFPGGPNAAHPIVVVMAEAAATKARTAAAGTQRAEVLATAIGTPTIEVPVPMTERISVSFATLHASVIRRLLAANTHLAASD